MGSQTSIDKESTCKWKMCTDFKDLNEACLKDPNSPPRINQLVDVTSGYELLNSKDAYSCQPTRKDEQDTSHTTFAFIITM